MSLHYQDRPAFSRGHRARESENHGGFFPRQSERSSACGRSFRSTEFSQQWSPDLLHVSAKIFIARNRRERFHRVGNQQKVSMNQILDVIARDTRSHAVETLIRESQQEQLPGGDLIDPARAQIK